MFTISYLQLLSLWVLVILVPISLVGENLRWLRENLKHKILTPELRCVEQKLSRQLELIQKPLAELGTDPVPNACTEVNSTGCVIFNEFYRQDVFRNKLCAEVTENAYESFDSLWTYLFFLFFNTFYPFTDFSIVLYGFQSHIIFAKYNEFSVQNLLAVQLQSNVFIGSQMEITKVNYIWIGSLGYEL